MSLNFTNSIEIASAKDWSQAVPLQSAKSAIARFSNTRMVVNLFNKNNRTRVYGYFASSGTTWTYVSSAYSNKIPCKPNTTYTARYNGNSTQAVLGFGSCSTDAEPSLSTGNVTVTQAIRQNGPTINTPVTITTGPNDKWLIVAYNVAEPQNTDMANNLQVEEGSTAKPYYPYFSPTTVLPHLKVHGKTAKIIVIDGKRYVVPSDVELVNDVTNGSNTNVDTGIYANDNIEMFVRVKAISGSFYLLQSRQTESATIYGISGSHTNGTITSFGLTSGITRTMGHIYTIKVTLSNSAVTLYVKDETAGTEDTKTGTASSSTYTFPSPTTIKLFGDASKLYAGVTVYDAYIKSNGSMLWYMCGATKNNTVGVWNPVNDQFITPTGTLTAGATKPVELNGVGDKTANLVDFNETRINNNTWATADKTKGFEIVADIYGKAISNSLGSNANCFGVFVPCRKGESVSLDFFNYAPYYGRCFYCEVDSDFKVLTTPVQYSNGTSALTQKTFTATNDNCIGFAIEWYISASQTRDYTKENYMVVKGSVVPTKYESYGYAVDALVSGNNLFGGAYNVKYTLAVPIKAGTAITFSGNNDSSQCYVYLYKANDTEITNNRLASTQSGRRFTTITPNEDVYAVKFSDASLNNLCIRTDGSVEYEPYITPEEHTVCLDKPLNYLLIPDEYDLVEYIKSTYTLSPLEFQYIYPELTMTSDGMTVEIEMEFDSLDASGNYLGIFGANSNFQLCVNKGSQVWSVGNADSTVRVVTGHRYHLKGVLSTNAAESEYWVDGVKLPLQRATAVGTRQFLFTTDMEQYFWSGKMYSCKVWIKGALVRNFMPSKQKSDSKFGMFCSVLQTFFKSVSSELPQAKGLLSAGNWYDFTGGPVVEIERDTLDFQTGIVTRNWKIEDGQVVPLATPTTTTIPVTPIALTAKGGHTVENTNTVKGQISGEYLGKGGAT